MPTAQFGAGQPPRHCHIINNNQAPVGWGREEEESVVDGEGRVKWN